MIRSGVKCPRYAGLKCRRSNKKEVPMTATTSTTTATRMKWHGFAWKRIYIRGHSSDSLRTPKLTSLYTHTCTSISIANARLHVCTTVSTQRLFCKKKKTSYKTSMKHMQDTEWRKIKNLQNKEAKEDVLLTSIRSSATICQRDCLLVLFFPFLSPF